MALLALLVIALTAGLGFVYTPSFFAAGGLLVVWAAGWLLKRGGGRWYAW